MKYSTFWRIFTVLASQFTLTPSVAAVGNVGLAAPYTVRSGDTFAKIARAKGVSLEELLATNRIANPDRILLGQRIVIPASKVKSARPAPPSSSVLVPAKGEPLPKQLPQPAGGGKSSPDNTTVNVTPPPAPKDGPYVVQSGDTLTRIQLRTGVPITSLLRLNGLTESSVIRPGQKLRLAPAGSKPGRLAQGQPIRRLDPSANSPVIIDNTRQYPDAPQPVAKQVEPPAATGTAPHKVESGETFSSISRLYGLTTSQLAGANRNVDPHRIRIGQSLMVPNQPLKPQPKPLIVRADGRVLAGRPDPLALVSNTEEEMPAGRTRTGYLVEEGETIQEIAQRFHTTEGVVRRLNRMGDSDNVYAGRYILVPFIRQAPQPARYANRDA